MFGVFFIYLKIFYVFESNVFLKVFRFLVGSVCVRVTFFFFLIIWCISKIIIVYSMLVKVDKVVGGFYVYGGFWYFVFD